MLGMRRRMIEVGDASYRQRIGDLDEDERMKRDVLSKMGKNATILRRCGVIRSPGRFLECGYVWSSDFEALE
jgi:hypothetical protein